jgi:ABC-type Fe3+ transport system permease subunit
MLNLVKSHGFIVGMLAFIGLVSIISAIGSKLFQGVRIFFYFFIALPIIFVVSIFRYTDRQKRKQELGEIRAYVKDNPDKLKKILFGFIVILFFMFIGIILLWLIANFFAPLMQFNEASKQFLQNYTLNQSNNTFTN